MPSNLSLKEKVRTAIRRPVAELVAIEADLLAASLKATTPAPVQTAYELAFPNVAAGASLHEFLSWQTGEEQVVGALNAIKGKLFEIRVVDELEKQGMVARLADATTQSGWDIAVTDPITLNTELIQIKATDSLCYASEHLARYPGIEIIGTDEIGSLDHVQTIGISNSELDAAVQDLLDTSIHFPFLAVLVAFASQVGPEFDFGSFLGKSLKSGTSFYVGCGIASVTGYWILGALGTVVCWRMLRGRSDGGRIPSLKEMQELQERQRERIAHLIARMEAIRCFDIPGGTAHP